MADEPPSSEALFRQLLGPAGLPEAGAQPRLRVIDGKDLDVSALAPDTRSLHLDYIRRPEFKNLAGLDQLPLEALEIRRYSGANLSAIPIPPTLKTLHIWQSSKLRSVAGLEVAQGLEALTWEQNGPLEDGSALTKLPNLKQLHLMGGLGSQQRLTSVDFLDGLQLEELTLNGIASEDVDLGPVVRMKSLRKIDVYGRNFPQEQIARIAAAHPSYYADLLDMPLNSDFLRDFCKKCDSPKVSLELRGTKFRWCPDCERPGIQRHLDRFDQLVQAARGAALDSRA